jgi:hypothetical protein
MGTVANWSSQVSLWRTFYSSLLCTFALSSLIVVVLFILVIKFRINLFSHRCGHMMKGSIIFKLNEFFLIAIRKTNSSFCANDKSKLPDRLKMTSFYERYVNKRVMIAISGERCLDATW